ncbi:MAG: tetratricopeptide repeat protein [Tepidisphaeraceae bacterium]|jgi:predicted O-linked N-acetylglucosamine transferase (SPINDLY family)
MPGQNAESLYNLGNTLAVAGKLDQAIAAYTRAVELRPEFFDAHFKLGNALANSAKCDEAAKSFRRALQIHPNHVDALNNLGNTLLATGQADEAVSLYRRVLALRPDHFLAHNNLAAGLVMTGQFPEALEFARRAVAMRPDYPPAHRNLGDALAALGQWPQAAQSYKKLVDLDSIHPRADPGAAADARMKLGAAMKHLGRFNEAISLFREAIALRPGDLEPHDHLANAYWENGDMDEALAVCRQAVQIHPTETKVHNNLGNVLLECGRLDDALASFDKAVELDPSNAVALSNKVFTIMFHPAYDSARILHELKQWERQFAPQTSEGKFPNDPSTQRRLRIGYVSADFRDHVVGRNVLPLLQRHDRAKFQLFCYSNDSPPDRFNQRFRALADGWRDIAAWPDDKLAAQIRADQIDILVDLSLHLGGSRLAVFARKPAPVRVTFGGYPGTTGLAAMDYRLTDPYLDPPGVPDDAYTERSVRLPHSFWCYDPAAMEVADAPEPGPPPAVAAGRITFGCLNNFRKINDRVLQLWAEVLTQAIGSRILLLAPRGSHRAALVDRLGQWGVHPDRVGFIDRGSRAQYLDSYRLIDIALDTVPYNGHTTSLDALWMGVPVVTLIGQTVAGRAGYSQTSNLGLPDLAARTEEQFTAIALALANDLPRLAELRGSLRPRMRASPLCDAVGWARGIEAAYRQMWQLWCDSRRP